MNLNRVCAGSVLALYRVAHARINTLSTLHLVRGVALQSIVNSLYFDAVLKEAKHKNPKKFLAVGLFLNAALAMTLPSRVNHAVACLFSILAIYKTHTTQKTSQTLTSQTPAALEIPDLLKTIVRKVPIEERGKLGCVAKGWNAAIGQDPTLFNLSMNTLLTIMNAPANDLTLRQCAAEALGRIGDRASVAPLTAIMNAPENDPYLRICAAEALGIIGDRASVEPLTLIMNGEAAPSSLRYHAATALAILLKRLNTSD